MKFESFGKIVRVAVCVCATASMLFAAPTARGDDRAAAADGSPFRWSAAVETARAEAGPVDAVPSDAVPSEAAPAGQATLEAIVLDRAIFAATRGDLADVRLRNRQGEPVAFVLYETPATKQHAVEKTWLAIERGAKPLPPKGLEIFIDPPRDLAGSVDGISIGTPLRNFEQQVRVYSSSDGADWQPAGPATVIFDYSRLVDVRNVHVPIFRGSDRHFRLVIDDVTADEAAELAELSRRFQGNQEIERSDRTIVDRRPFRVDRITFYRSQVETETTGLESVRYPASGFRTEQDPKNKRTLLEFDAGNVPVSSVRLLTGESNFSRSAALQIREEGSDAMAKSPRWRTVANRTLLRFSLGTLKKDELLLRCPEQRNERYRIVVENRDSPPVSFDGVEVEGPEYQLVFLAAAGQSLTLDYGWPKAAKANYDTAAIQASLAAGNLPARAELAAAVENQPVERPGWNLTALFGNPWIVVCMVAGLSVVLAWALYRAARRVDGTPPV
jgi:hypothetical protein